MGEDRRGRGEGEGRGGEGEKEILGLFLEASTQTPDGRV
jgi:hypothetical protein